MSHTRIFTGHCKKTYATGFLTVPGEYYEYVTSGHTVPKTRRRQLTEGVDDSEFCKRVL